jgi:stage III sporulation protein SpoIIIAA
LVTVEELVNSDLNALLDALPERVTNPIRSEGSQHDLLEIVMDLGRVPEARFVYGDSVLEDRPIDRTDLKSVIDNIGNFGKDNRAGIERTLHRISAIRNRKGDIVGITCRVGRAVLGTIKIIEDLAFSGKNILLVGKPGVGKTTMLRETARVLADDAKKRVIIVDTSNEIAGDGDVPHPAIGHARRMQVTTPANQHDIMIEAVENHMPEVIIIDEMGTEREAVAARTIAERGVQLVATAHGNTLDNLILNPTLSDLIGGVQTVTLSDQEAKFRGTQKTVLERKAPPTFDVIIEIQGWQQVAVHEDVADTIDQALRGYQIIPEIRRLDENGNVERVKESPRHSEGTPGSWAPANTGNKKSQTSLTQSESPATKETSSRYIDEKVFMFGISRDKLEAAQSETGITVDTTNELKMSTIVLTTKTHYRRGAQLVKVAEASGTPVYVLRKNTMPQLIDFLNNLARNKGIDVGVISYQPGPDTTTSKMTLEQAMNEAEEAAQKVLGGEFSILLSPQRPYVRRLQHMLAEKFSLASTSKGKEPARAVLIYKP